MKKYSFLNIGLLLFVNIVVGQGFKGGFGVELNQTRFRQFAPTITVPFENPHSPGIGLNTYIFIDYSLSEFFTIRVAPLLGFYNTKSKVTSSYQMNIYGFRTESLFKNKSLRVGCGLEYNRLQKILGTTTRGSSSDWTFFAHRRDLFGPTVSIWFEIFNNFSANFRSTYFLKDFYSSGAIDYDGNIIGPIEVTPFVIAFGFEYNLGKILGKSKESK